MPNFSDFPIDSQVATVKFEITGRRLFVFEGEKDVWRELSLVEQVRSYFIHLTRSFQLLTLIFSLGLPSCSGSPYPRIIVQIRSPTQLFRLLAP